MFRVRTPRKGSPKQLCLLLSIVLILFIYLLSHAIRNHEKPNNEEEFLCTTGLRDLDGLSIPNIALFISSSFKHKERRDAVRQSWMRYISDLKLQQ